MLYNPIIKAFKELDADMLDRQIAWALDRNEALRQYKKNYNRKTDGSYIAGAIEICGGKTWYNALSGRSEQDIVGFAAKNVATIIKNRNDRIVTALLKKGINEIPEFTLIHCSNGYEGTFIVAGHKVHIETILAGGYNIQCLHQRTLVKVKAAA